MSTQTARSIGFTHTSPQQGFRLLELSPDLLKLLESDNPPTLYLKSFAVENNTPHAFTSTNDNIGKADSNLHDHVSLCTPTQTFRLRQVHSSNSVHIIRPSNGRLSLGNSDDELDTETLTAIARCGSTLEAHEWKEEDAADGIPLAVPFLEQMLRLYTEAGHHHHDHRDEDDVEMRDALTATSDTVPGSHSLQNLVKLRETIMRDIPLSAAQCDAGWRELCAFVWSGEAGNDRGTDSESGQVAFRPSATVRLDVWKRILEGSLLQSIDLEKQFLVRDLWKALLYEDGEAPFPYALFEAVVFHLAELQPSDSRANSSGVKWANLDRNIAMRWVGETYLEVCAPTRTSLLGRSEFLNSWKDLLPEDWRNEASLGALRKSLYTFPDASSIRFVTPAERESLKKGASTAGTTAKGSRDWHERFKSQRNN